MSTKSRRDFLASAGKGFGAVAASALLPEGLRANSPLAPKASHEPARAKAVIYLYKPRRYVGPEARTDAAFRENLARQLRERAENQPHRFH